LPPSFDNGRRPVEAALSVQTPRSSARRGAPTRSFRRPVTISSKDTCFESSASRICPKGRTKETVRDSE
jgi:hypothetical protein